MANITKIYDIKIQGEKELVTKMQQVNKQFDDAKKRWKDLKAIISAGGLSSAEMEKYKLELQASKVETEKLRQETIKLNNEGKALTNATRIQREEQRKNKEETKLSLTEYQKLSRELNTLRNNAKEVRIVFGAESKEFKAAASEVNKLDKEIKAIDASLGQFQRNVGNYPKEIKIGGISTGVIDQLKNAGLGDLLGNQVEQTKGKVIQLNSEFLELKQRMDEAKTSGVADLNALENEIIQNRIAADNLNKEIQESQTHLNGLGSVGSGVFGKMGGDIKNLVLGYVGLQAAMAGVQELIQGTKELSDTTTNLEIELGGTSDTAGQLVENLGKLDTRTKLTSLAEIANIATKAGTAEENLLSVTEAIDKVKVSFGKDFGDVETGTETFAKLINIFYEDREITGDRILKIGNSIRTLANETVASVPFINDFNGRMAGLRQTFTNFELSDSIGLGAGFEEFKQSAEVSSTALVKILPKLAADTEKFAKILGIPQAEFKKLINQNPAEALIRVSEKLVKSGKGVEEIATSFADAELGAGRVTTILGTLGGKADVFRERIARAKDTINDTTNINEAFRKKNENLAGTLDKISKKFSDLANNKSFINFISIAGSTILGLISIITGIPFGWWIGMVTFLTLAYWENITAVYANIVATSGNILAQGRLLAIQALSNALILLSTIINTAAAIAVYAVAYSYQFLNIVLNVLTSIFPILRTAMLALNSTFLATPIGWFVVGILAITAASKAFGQEVEKTSNAIKKQGQQLKETAAQMRVNKEIEEKINSNTKETILKLEQLTKIVKNNAYSLETRGKALKELIAINPEYLNGLTLENIKTAEGVELLKKYKDKLIEVAKAKAVQGLIQEKSRLLVEAEYKQTELESKIDEKYTGSKAKFAKNALVDTFRNIGADVGLGDGAETYQNDLVKENIKKLKEDLEVLTDKAIANSINGVSTGILEADNNTNPDDKKDDDKGSKLSGQQKDYLRDFNALREAELSELKKAKLEGSITEEEFLIKSLAVNIKYNDQILDHFKGTDAVTRKLRADTASDTIDKKIETNEKLFKLQEDELNQTLANEKAIAQAKIEEVNSDPYATALDKARAEEEYYSTLLNLQVDFNTKMDVLEQQFSLKSKKNAEERKNLILKEQSDLNKKRYELSKVQFESLITGTKDFEEYRKNLAAIEASKKRMEILNNKSFTQEQKQHEIEKINSAETLANISAELGAINAQIAHYEKLKETQRLTNDELGKYNELLKTKQLLEEKKGAGEQELKIKGIVELQLPSAQSLQKKIQSLFSDANGKFIIGTDANGNGVDGSALLGQAIAQSFDLASQAMSNYFEGERAAVEKSKQIAYERIDIEKNQLLAKSQSARESESIEKQSAEKKKLADKEAGERLKKIKKSEAAVAFATQLAYIAVAAAQNPLNGITLGAAGIAMYATLAAIATAGYFMNVSNINKQQFARGGKLPTRGGQFVGSSHSNGGIPVGMNEFEGDELAIINKKSAKSNEVFTITGTPNQIASKINSIGGGVDWAGGASMTKFMNGGSFLGSNVEPPIFRSYLDSRVPSNSDSNIVDITALHDSIIELRNIVLLESRKKIILNPNEVQDYQREKNKQSEIATL